MTRTDGGRFRHDFSSVPLVPPSVRGEALPQPLRGALERRFDAPLDGVRVRRDRGAREQLRAQRAEAAAAGETLLFTARAYRPGTGAGRRLIAHEVAHVLQARLPGAAADRGGVEAEAARAGERFAAGSGALPLQRPLPAAPSFLPTSAATLKAAFEDELDDFFVTITNVWPAIRAEGQPGRDEVRADGALERKIRSEAPPKKLLRTYLLLAYQTEAAFPAHFVAILDATERLGTHEARIYTVLRGVDPTERGELQRTPGLVETLEDEMSGRELDLALELLYDNVGATQTGHHVSAARGSTHLEVGERYSLDVGARGNLGDVVLEVGAAAEAESARTILDDTSLWAVLADEFDEEEVWYLRMIATFRGQDKLPRRPSAYVANIWDAVEGWGTKESKLIAELTTVRPDAAARSTLVNDPWFVPMLRAELSGGDLRDAYAAIGLAGRAEPGIRGTLVDAVKDRDMGRIRTLLTDANLAAADRERLRFDDGLLDAMGGKLSGADLCETSLLLKYGAAPLPTEASDLLVHFRQTPINVAGAETFLKALSQVQQANLRREPGVYFMLTGSGLSVGDRGRLLAAIRSHDPAWQVAGSEGTHRTHVESVSSRLPVHFAPSEIRIPLRLNIDTSKASGGFKMSSKTLETWTRAIDDIWNGSWALRSGAHTIPLVVVPYFAVGIARADATVFVYDQRGRSFRRGVELHLFLEGTSGDGLEPKTVAHELGHVLGNPDEYDLPAAEYTRFTGATEPEVRGGRTVKGLMGSQYLSTAVAERHYGAILEAANALRDPARFPDPFVLSRRK